MSAPLIELQGIPPGLIDQELLWPEAGGVSL